MANNIMQDVQDMLNRVGALIDSNKGVISEMQSAIDDGEQPNGAGYALDETQRISDAADELIISAPKQMDDLPPGDADDLSTMIDQLETMVANELDEQIRTFTGLYHGVNKQHVAKASGVDDVIAAANDLRDVCQAAKDEYEAAAKDDGIWTDNHAKFNLTLSTIYQYGSEIIRSCESWGQDMGEKELLDESIGALDRQLETLRSSGNAAEYTDADSIVSVVEQAIDDVTGAAQRIEKQHVGKSSMRVTDQDEIEGYEIKTVYNPERESGEQYSFVVYDPDGNELTDDSLFDGEDAALSAAHAFVNDKIHEDNASLKFGKALDSSNYFTEIAIGVEFNLSEDDDAMAQSIMDDVANAMKAAAQEALAKYDGVKVEVDSSSL